MARPPGQGLGSQQSGRRALAQRLLLLEEQLISIDPRSAEPLGLTPREAEVLAWVAQGKTNDETARILGLSPRTVAKHLEMIYQELGAENRTVAAARAWAAMQQVEETTATPK